MMQNVINDTKSFVCDCVAGFSTVLFTIK